MPRERAQIDLCGVPSPSEEMRRAEERRDWIARLPLWWMPPAADRAYTAEG